jgi:hypothetical protein
MMLPNNSLEATRDDARFACGDRILLSWRARVGAGMKNINCDRSLLLTIISVLLFTGSCNTQSESIDASVLIEPSLAPMQDPSIEPDQVTLAGTLSVVTQIPTFTPVDDPTPNTGDIQIEIKVELLDWTSSSTRYVVQVDVTYMDSGMPVEKVNVQYTVYDSYADLYGELEARGTGGIGNPVIDITDNIGNSVVDLTVTESSTAFIQVKIAGQTFLHLENLHVGPLLPTPTPSGYPAFESYRTLYDEIIQPGRVEWSPDGQYIAVTMVDSLLLLRETDLSIIASYISDATESTAIRLPAFSENGSYLAAADGKKVIVLDGRTGEVLFEKEDRKPYALQFINDQDLMIGYIPYTILETITHRMGVGTISSRTYYTYNAYLPGPYTFANQGESLIYWGINDIYVLEAGRNPPVKTLPWGILLETALDKHVIMADVRQCALRIYQSDDDKTLGDFSWCDAEGGGQRIRDSVGQTMLATEFEIDLERDLIVLGHENRVVTVWKLSTGELITQTTLPLFSEVYELKFNPVLPELAILASDPVAIMEERANRDFLTILEFDID